MEKIPEKFIVAVVPVARIPLNRDQSFFYLFDSPIPEGSLVRIPFSNRIIEGIVTGSKNDFERLGNIELKKISAVLEENFLCKKQIRMASFLSEYYFSPLGIILKSFVPKRTKARSKKKKTENKEQETKNRKPETGIVLTKEQKNAVKIISETTYNLQTTNYLLFGPSGSGKTEVYIHSMLELRKKDKGLQFLILLPEKTLTPQAIERYGKYFKPEEIAVLSSNISKGQFYSYWQKIKSGEIKVIIGTRMAVFAPFKNLGLIIIDEEQDISFKQWDMNPRYDARNSAEKLAEIFRCPIVRGSATPSVESYWRTKKNELKLLELPQLKIPDKKYPLPNIIMADMKKERWSKNYSCISKILKNEISYALKNGQQIILFVNRQGLSNFSVCEKCKTVLSCPKCERALIYKNSGEYGCIHCNYKTSIIPNCPKCKGLVFKNIGIGTQKVEKEIENIFPGAKILRLDSESLKTKDAHQKIYDKFSRGETDILIGTQMISKGWDLPRVSLVGIIDLDNLLSVPDFSTEEKAFQLVIQTIGRTGRPGAKFPGVAVIQTFNPEKSFSKLLTSHNYQSFCENELQERKILKYPPFGKIIKLVFQDYSFNKVEKETATVFSRFENISKIRVSEPQDSFIPKIRGRYRRQIILRFEDSPTAEIRKIIKSLPSGWIIDVDPISIV